MATSFKLFLTCYLLVLLNVGTSQTLLKLPIQGELPVDFRVFHDSEYTVAAFRYSKTFSVYFYNNQSRLLAHYQDETNYRKVTGYSFASGALHVYSHASVEEGDDLSVVSYEPGKQLLLASVEKSGLRAKYIGDLQHSNKYYRMYASKKEKSLTLYELRGQQLILVKSFVLPEELYRAVDGKRFFQIHSRYVDPEALLSSRGSYWQGDSIILSYQTPKTMEAPYKQNTLVLDLHSGKFHQRIIDTGGRADHVNDFILDDKVFTISATPDSLELGVKEFSGGKSVRHTIVEENLQAIKQTPYIFNISGLPNPLASIRKGMGVIGENWGAQNYNRKLLKEMYLSRPFVYAAEAADGYQLTMGCQYLIADGNFSVPAGYTFFVGCLTLGFQPTTCRDPRSLNHLALDRRQTLLNDPSIADRFVKMFYSERGIILCWANWKGRTLQIEVFK